MAVSGAGEPLGLLHQHTWSRSQRAGKRGEYRKKATCDKESQRWLDTLTAAERGIDESFVWCIWAIEKRIFTICLSRLEAATANC